VTITSVHNPLIAEVRSLHRRKGRREQGAFLVEGVRLVGEAADMGAPIRSVFFCAAMLGDMERDLRARLERLSSAPRVVAVASAVMRLLADTETPQGVVAVVAMPTDVLPPLDPRRTLLLVLDGLRDPGNVGTLLRAGAAAGCDAVMTTFGSADAYAPKVVRAAMGAHFRLPVLSDVAWDWLGPALAPLPAIYGADASASQAYDAVDWTAGAAVVVGNEDHGISEEALRWCRRTVAIPMAGGIESLNAAVSGSIILFEAVRQRRIAARG
jgi:RNA methyltransferase, TrmH family